MSLEWGTGRRPNGRATLLALFALWAGAAWGGVAWSAGEPSPLEPAVDGALDRRVAVLEIGPRTVPCDDVVPRRCFEVRRAGEGDWAPFGGTIEGFAHRMGFATVVLVEHRSGRDVTTDDAETIDAAEAIEAASWTLLRVLAELPLGGAEWVLERYGALAAMRDPLPLIDVLFVVRSAGSHIEGTTGCNAFSGPISFDEEHVAIGPLEIGSRVCDHDVMEQERVVLAALAEATRVTFYGDGVGFAGETLRLRFGARTTDARLTWTQGPDDPEVGAFDALLRRAAAGGERWVHDPIRVSLAFIDSRGAPRVDIERRDDRAEAPTSTLIRIDEDGFLDDSVRGVRTDVVLAPDDEGVWHVLAVSVTTRCWRGGRSIVGPGELCP
ncbi:MAG: META domain-containing protein [Trueperaceae bacterium]|nr:META domain-containing protein [Trueperaceae bacterium]